MNSLSKSCIILVALILIVILVVYIAVYSSLEYQEKVETDYIAEYDVIHIACYVVPTGFNETGITFIKKYAFVMIQGEKMKFVSNYYHDAVHEQYVIISEDTTKFVYNRKTSSRTLYISKETYDSLNYTNNSTFKN